MKAYIKIQVLTEIKMTATWNLYLNSFFINLNLEILCNVLYVLHIIITVIKKNSTAIAGKIHFQFIVCIYFSFKFFGNIRSMKHL